MHLLSLNAQPYNALPYALYNALPYDALPYALYNALPYDALPYALPYALYNALPYDVVNSRTVNTFKNRPDAHWEGNPPDV